MTKFTNIKISELFTIESTKWYKCTKDELLSDTGTISVISNGTRDNGVLGYSKKEANNDGKVITYSDTTLGADTFFYQKVPFIGYSHIKKLIPINFEITDNIAHYIISTIKSSIRDQYDWGAKLTDKALLSTEIFVPFLDDKLDIEYIDNYISTIINRNNLKIETYVQKLGFLNLNSLELTDSDFDILNKHTNSNFKSFQLQKLFDNIERGKRLKSDDRINGDLPFVTAGIRDTGISAYVGNDIKKFPANSLTIDMFGTTFFRGYEYGADDHITILYNDGNKFNRYILQYIQPIIEKTILGQYSYSKNFYSSDAPEIEIKLPSKGDNPDLELMSAFMLVMQKKALAPLVSKIFRK